MSTEQPRRSRWFIMLMGFLALFQGGAAVRVLHIAPDLAAQITLSLALEFVVSLLWTGTAALTARALWLRRAAAGRQARAVLIGFVGYSLLRLILFAQAPYDRGRLPFLLVVGGLLCASLVVPWLLRHVYAYRALNGDES
ncbi:MAG: hypothetical protein JNM70_11335 [Anaerolineae bacterium]|nr:hypothetical protein [Anaerolineae bacterium]